MKKLLLVVEDSFQLTGRGVVLLPPVAPDILGTRKNGHRAFVEIVQIDGTKYVEEAAFYWEFFEPGGAHLLCFLRNEMKDRVPAGAEIWLQK